jgi:hypothetical protein
MKNKFLKIIVQPEIVFFFLQFHTVFEQRFIV